jgi:hypothetical protein
MSSKALRGLAAWDLERNKDYYPAGAMNKDGCFYNGQIGNCGLECPCFINGGCPVEADVLEAHAIEKGAEP